ncbi:MAG: DUF3601 domain-containing protein [Cytophagales bacterium]|nr:DUF3601 domain-containing protein [Cytophagales bacterium]
MTTGQKIKVIKEFIDFDQDIQSTVDRVLTFSCYDYFPYDGGYTFQFEEVTIRLAEIFTSNEQVLNNFSEYFELVR